MLTGEFDNRRCSVLPLGPHTHNPNRPDGPECSRVPGQRMAQVTGWEEIYVVVEVTK